MRILKKNPLLKGINHYLIDSPQPSNISYWWNIGSLLGLCLGMQLITGVFLAMHYNSSVAEAFNSVEHIMRDVNYGWFIRYMHANGASAFFFLVYLHIGRGFYYGSYKNPSTLTWIIGTFIFILMMATAFLGYVLPYGQMSLWGATVITNLMSAIPWIGKDIVEFIWGGFSVNNATLNRFFALHYLLPFVIAALALFHLIVLHDKGGSNNPLGLSGNYDRIPMAPYFLFKDLITIFIFMLVFSVFIFFSPNYLGDSENYVMANPMQTPPAIVPEWYLLPFYAILRSIPNKLLGVIAMFSAILALLSLPFTDRGITRGLEFKPINKIMFFIFIANFFILMILGAKHVETPFIELGQICTLIYFAYFGLVIFFSLQENALGELSNTKQGIFNFPLKSSKFMEKLSNFIKLKSFNSFRKRISLSSALHLLKKESERSDLIGVFIYLYWYDFRVLFDKKIAPQLYKISAVFGKLFLPVWKVVNPLFKLAKKVSEQISLLLGKERTKKLKKFLTKFLTFKAVISIIWICYDSWDSYLNWGSHQIMSVRKYINLNPAGNVRCVYPPGAFDIYNDEPGWWRHMIVEEMAKFRRNQQIEKYNEVMGVLREKSQGCREWGRWLVRLNREQIAMWNDSPYISSGAYANARQMLATIDANVEQLKCDDVYNAALEKHFRALGDKKATFEDIASIYAKATLDEIDFKIALAKAKASASPVPDIASRPRVSISSEVRAFTEIDAKKYSFKPLEPRPWEKW